MNKKKILLIVPILLAMAFVGFSCKDKETEKEPTSELVGTTDTTEIVPAEPINITLLYEKPLDTIKHYIQGKWKVVYTDGGGSGITHYYDDNEYTYEFATDDRVMLKFRDYDCDTAQVTWIKKKGAYQRDSFYVMLHIDMEYLFDKIDNDTLVYRYYNVSDAPFYHLIQIKK